MKIRLLGSHLCQDTLYALMKLKDEKVTVEFGNISTNFPVLKEFMNMREQDPVFCQVKEQGGLGIPLFILEDGTRSLSLSDVLARVKGESGK